MSFVQNQRFWNRPGEPPMTAILPVPMAPNPRQREESLKPDTPPPPHRQEWRNLKIPAVLLLCGVMAIAACGDSPDPITFSKLDIAAYPTKINYTVGEAFSSAGLTLTAYYSDGSTVPVTSGWTLSWYGSTLAEGVSTLLEEGDTAITAHEGEKTVTVAWQGRIIDFAITVSAAVTLDSIVVYPEKTFYDIGDAFSAAGLSLNAYYSDGSTVPVTTGWDISWNGFPLEEGDTAITAHEGSKTVIVTWQGLTASFDIYVSPDATLSSISVAAQPTKTAYIVGEAFSAAGLSLNAYYSDGSTVPVTTGWTLSWNGSTLAEGDTDITANGGTKTIAVTWQEKTASFDIYVATLNNIFVNNSPTTINYTVGDAFSAAGLTLTAIYSTGPSISVTTGWTLSWNGSTLEEGDTAITANEGTKTIAVAWQGKTTSFDIYVAAKAGSLNIDAQPTKTVYAVGEGFSAAGLALSVHYADGSTDPVTSGWTLSWYNPAMGGYEELGEGYTSITAEEGYKPVIVAWRGYSDVFYITVRSVEAATPPAEASDIAGTAGDGRVTLNWTDPPDADLAHIEITWNGGDFTAQKSTAGNRANSATITGLANGTAYIFTLKTVDAEGNKSAGTATGALTPRPPSGGVVTVQFAGLPQDETITLSGAETPLSWAANTLLTVSAGETFDAYRWDLDGETLTGKTGQSLTLNAGELSVKKHTLTVFATKNAVRYTKTLTFTVAQ